ncbi:preATP grasp domain-containing protein [Arenibacterium sp. CAU 1754]
MCATDNRSPPLAQGMPACWAGPAIGPVAVAPEMHSRILRLADEIARSDPRIGDVSGFGDRVHIGHGNAASILIGDTAEIPLLMTVGRGQLDYRLGWLARDGDLVLVGGSQVPEFEAYQKLTLGAPHIRYHQVRTERDGQRNPVAQLCLRDSDVYAELLAFVRATNGATLAAHYTTGTIWALAARLSAESGHSVHVAGPPPVLSRRVNNKLWFGAVAARLLGKEAVPPKRTAQSTSALTGHVRDMSRKWDRIVVKVPDSAGSAGNVVLESADLRSMTARDIHAFLRQELSVLGWPPPFPVAIEVWDFNALTSPSVQTWIPPAGQTPVIEGVYEQVLEGDQHAFAGAVEADLPDHLRAELILDGVRLALLFQALGYYGRCSFDAIAYGESLDRARLHWIECNGRWGGVSVPMTLINLLSGGRTRPPHVIVQRNDLAFAPRRFDEVLGEFADVRPSSDLSTGTVFLTPYSLSTGTGCHHLTFGASREDAMDRSRAIMTRLLG